MRGRFGRTAIVIAQAVQSVRSICPIILCKMPFLPVSANVLPESKRGRIARPRLGGSRLPQQAQRLTGPSADAVCVTTWPSITGNCVPGAWAMRTVRCWPL